MEDLMLAEWVFQALEAASMCWENPAGAGEFDSGRCETIGDALLAHINQLIEHAMGRRRPPAPAGAVVIVTSQDGLAQALRERRLELGLPLRVVADRAGMPLQQIHEIEKSKVRPGAGVLLRLTPALGLQWALLPAGGHIVYR